MPKAKKLRPGEGAKTIKQTIHDEAQDIRHDQAGGGGEFDRFWAEQQTQHEILNKKLDELSPLVALIPQLQTIADTQKAMQFTMRWVGKFVVFVGLVVGIIYTTGRIFVELFDKK